MTAEPTGYEHGLLFHIPAPALPICDLGQVNLTSLSTGRILTIALHRVLIEVNCIDKSVCERVWHVFYAT